jgi:hypothetical protein
LDEPRPEHHTATSENNNHLSEKSKIKEEDARHGTPVVSFLRGI